MSFENHDTIQVDLSGTMLVGTIQAQRRHLEQVFGTPLMGEDERINLEWRLRFDDGLVASIYDWNQPYPEPDEVRVWRIGGVGVHAMHRVHEAFREARRAA